MASSSTATGLGAQLSSSRRKPSSRSLFLRASGLNLAIFPTHLVRRLEADAKYSVYLNRQAEDVARYRRDDSAALPADLDYGRLSGLSNEIKQKFIAVRPVSLGQARRIEGVTPAALALIAAHARRAERSSGRDRLPAGT